jgi:DNA repair exonuclease SbcCD ATPase subunit
MTSKTITTSSIDLADEVEKSIRALSTEELHHRINNASKERNRIAAAIRKTNSSLDEIMSALGQLEVMASESPRMAAKHSELETQATALKDERRKLEASYRGAGEIMPVIEAELRARESAAVTAQREILVRRFPHVFSIKKPGGHSELTDEANELVSKVAALLVGQALHESFFSQNIDGTLLADIPALAQKMFDQAKDSAHAESKKLIEAARIRSVKGK